ncbi:hypothetical protein ACFVZH_36230 [Streptomyces sp. NPDC059534]|uniref:hypothetical protein n=1 Tax=Streptomyces sp. NPDC059534 TaxID=3346859 RepID=UPI003699AA72
MPPDAPKGAVAGRGCLVVGDTALARRVCWSATLEGHAAHRLTAPKDADLRRTLAARPDAVAIVTAGDVSALQYALALRHLDASVPLVVSISDRTIARHLQDLLDHCTVFSPADLIAPSLVS